MKAGLKKQYQADQPEHVKEDNLGIKATFTWLTTLWRVDSDHHWTTVYFLDAAIKGSEAYKEVLTLSSKKCHQPNRTIDNTEHGGNDQDSRKETLIRESDPMAKYESEQNTK